MLNQGAVSFPSLRGRMVSGLHHAIWNDSAALPQGLSEVNR